MALWAACRVGRTPRKSRPLRLNGTRRYGRMSLSSVIGSSRTLLPVAL
jgi:hypothetical protein